MSVFQAWLSLTSCVLCINWFNLSEPQFSHLLKGLIKVPISCDNMSVKFSITCKALSKVHGQHSINSIDIAVLLFTDPFFTAPLSLQASTLKTLLHGNLTLLYIETV